MPTTPVIPIACAAAVDRFGCATASGSRVTRFAGRDAAREDGGSRARDVEREPGPRGHDADLVAHDREAGVFRRAVDLLLEPREVRVGGRAR